MLSGQCSFAGWLLSYFDKEEVPQDCCPLHRAVGIPGEPRWEPRSHSWRKLWWSPWHFLPWFSSFISSNWWCHADAKHRGSHLGAFNSWHQLPLRSSFQESAAALRICIGLKDCVSQWSCEGRACYSAGPLHKQPLPTILQRVSDFLLCPIRSSAKPQGDGANQIDVWSFPPNCAILIYLQPLSVLSEDFQSPWLWFKWPSSTLLQQSVQAPRTLSSKREFPVPRISHKGKG